MKLSDKDKEKLKEHSKHHSEKHIAMMNQMMKNGKSFAEAHRAAQKSVGK